MVEMSKIEELSNRIAQEFRPEQIILFGSHAYGQPTADSDVDLLIIMEFAGHSARKAREIRRRVQPVFAVDLLVRTPEQVRQRLTWNDWFLREVTEKGKILYASPHNGMDHQS
jgi:predicted nucleotidyltransferase